MKKVLIEAPILIRLQVSLASQTEHLGSIGARVVDQAGNPVTGAVVWMLPIDAYGQTGPDPRDKVGAAIAQLKSGNFALATVEQIAEAHAVQAIPALKEQFALSKDATVMAKVAGVLVKLGDKDDVYWSYLIEQATAAIQSSIPLPTVYDANGMVVRGQVSKDFLDWVKAHEVSPELAAQDAVFGNPGKVAILGDAGDPRAIPLLRQALQSANFMIATMAAKGLASIQDKDSIPLIIDACRKAPSDAATAIADSLIYFDDDRAQAAADTFLPREYAATMREAKARGKGPFHY